MKKRGKFYWNFFPGHFWGWRTGFPGMPMPGFGPFGWRRRLRPEDELEFLEDYLQELKEMEQELKEEREEVEARIKELKNQMS